MKHSTISDLEPQTLREIFRLVEPQQCAQLATCQKLWRNISTDDSLWQTWGHKDFAMLEAKTPTGQLQHSYRSAYAAWYTSVGKYRKYARRTIVAWRKIENWTQEHHPDIASSLGESATEVELNDAERALGFKIPDSLRVIYRLHNGQELSCDDRFPNLMPSSSMFHGLFGGYSFYDHIVCTRFLPVGQAVQGTLRLRDKNLSIDYGDGLKIGFGCFADKGFMLLDNGCQLRVSSCDAAKSWDAVPPGGQDAALRWLEHYADALQQRLACSQLHGRLTSRGICLYPMEQPWQRVCVTRGVRVQAVAIFVPELSKQSSPQEPDPAYFFSYNVEFSLLPKEEQQEYWSDADSPFVSPITSVQLQSRHWIIRDEHGQVTSEIQGDGVIGKHPILVPGGTPFVYQSCTHQPQSKGSMEGFFRFVEGTTSAPTGPEFDVECPQFMLEKPDYIF